MENRVRLFCGFPGFESGASLITVNLSATRSVLHEATKKRSPHKVWCDPGELEIFPAKMGSGFLRGEEEAALQLSEGHIHDDIRELIHGEPMSSTSTIQGWLEELQLPFPPYPRYIHLLVMIPRRQHLPEDPSAEKVVVRPYPMGLAPYSPRLPRARLVEWLYNAVQSGQFSFILSPSGSGKTSLLILFQKRYPEICSTEISFMPVAVHATYNKDVLVEYGVEALRRECNISIIQQKFRRPDDIEDPPTDEQFVFLLDDAHFLYHDMELCRSLFKNSAEWIPSNVRFVISATHALEMEDPDSSVVFGEFSRKLMREDLLVGDEEARELFALENGLPPKMRSPLLEEIILRESNGHMILLRDLIDVIAMDFQRRLHTDSDLLQHCFSETMMSYLLRCFGVQHTTPSPRLSSFLTKCLLKDSNRQPVEWSAEERDCFIDLKTSGIIIEDVDGRVEFASPLAGRFYYRWQFMDRSYRDPASLHDLVKSVIGNMAVSELKGGTLSKLPTNMSLFIKSAHK